jgi:hypothetical protein
MIGNEPMGAVHNGYVWEGMTIRQYFVAQAMKGLAPEVLNLSGVEGKNAFQILAFDVVRLADACLARELETREK